MNRFAALLLCVLGLVQCQWLAVSTRTNEALSLISDSLVVMIGGSLQFTGQGGSPPYIYSVQESVGSGTIDSATGVYTAPLTAKVERVLVRDSVGTQANLDITVSSGLSLGVQSQTILTGTPKELLVTGGVSPFSFSLVSGLGSVSESGFFTADWAPGSSTLEVLDARQNSASLTLTRTGSEVVLGGSGIESVTSGAVDSNGNVYVAGATNGSLLSQTALGNYDAFVIKLNSKGVVQWVKQFGTAGYDKVHGLQIDSDQRIVVVGETASALPSQSQVGGVDCFIRVYTTEGEEVWTSQFGTTSTDRAFAVAVDNTNSVIYIAGQTYGVMEGSSSGSSDLFLTQFSFNGTRNWTDQSGTSYLDIARGVTVDPSGYPYITGTLGYASGASPTFNGVGYAQFANPSFVVKYSSAGSVLWTVIPSSGGQYPYSGYGIVADANGSLYVAFKDEDSFVNSNYGVAIAKLSTHNGNQVWAAAPTENYSGYYFGAGISLDASNNPVLASVSYNYMTEAGTYQYQGAITQFNTSTGAEIWNATVGDVANTTLGVVSASSADRTQFFMMGITNASLGGYDTQGAFDIFLAKYNSSGEKQ